MVQSVSSESFQRMKKWEKCVVLRSDGCRSEGPRQGWSSGLPGTPCTSARRNAKSCSWGGANPGTSVCWGPPSWKAAWLGQKRTPAWTQESNVHLWYGRLMAFWATLNCRIVSVCGEMWCCPCTQPWWGPTAPVLSSPAQDRMALLEKVQWRVTKMIKGAWAHHTARKAESLEKRKHRWDLTSAYKDLKEGCKKDGARPFAHEQVVFSDMTRGRGYNWNTGGFSGTTGNLYFFCFFWRRLSMGISCRWERLWNSHPWRNSKAVCSGQLAPGDHAWAGVLD